MSYLKYLFLKKNDSHLSELKALFELPEIQKWISISPNYFDYVVETKDAYLLKILMDGVLVGVIQFEVIDNIMYIAIIVQPKYQGKGIAKTAINHVISNYNRKKYIAEIEENNIKSIKLFESLGFNMESQDDDLITYAKVVGENI